MEGSRLEDDTGPRYRAPFVYLLGRNADVLALYRNLTSSGRDSYMRAAWTEILAGYGVAGIGAAVQEGSTQFTGAYLASAGALMFIDGIVRMIAPTDEALGAGLVGRIRGGAEEAVRYLFRT